VPLLLAEFVSVAFSGRSQGGASARHGKGFVGRSLASDPDGVEPRKVACLRRICLDTL
jgi:hypothetical protein